jgi:serine/threonine protein kinase
VSNPNYNVDNKMIRNNSKKDNEISNINVNLHINVNINNITSKQQIQEQTTQESNIQRKSLHLKSFDCDDYTIIKQIGQGTFAKIYEVMDNDRKRFAMKKILASSVEEINALINEYDMLKSLSMYNLSLINIYAIDTKQLDKTTHVMYLLMDLALCDWEKEIEHRGTKQQFYTESELIIILKSLTQTFAELQRHNVSHRDIKPQNVLLLPDGSFRISDFGEAKRIIRTDKQTVRQTIRGTELYMSPILFKALKTTGIQDGHTLHNTYKSDVYSLGLCFVLAATLTFKALSVIRELEDMATMKNKLNQFLKGKYSNKFVDILYFMIEIDEKLRVDFIELEKHVQNI